MDPQAHTCTHTHTQREQVIHTERDEGPRLTAAIFTLLENNARKKRVKREDRGKHHTKKFLFIFFSQKRSNWGEERSSTVWQAKHHENLTMCLPRLELTLGLPQWPLSNGCTSQGKYPAERRTSGYAAIIKPQKSRA